MCNLWWKENLVTHQKVSKYYENFDFESLMVYRILTRSASVKSSNSKHIHSNCFGFSYFSLLQIKYFLKNTMKFHESLYVFESYSQNH